MQRPSAAEALRPQMLMPVHPVAILPLPAQPVLMPLQSARETRAAAFKVSAVCSEATTPFEAKSVAQPRDATPCWQPCTAQVMPSLTDGGWSSRRLPAAGCLLSMWESNNIRWIKLQSAYNTPMLCSSARCWPAEMPRVVAPQLFFAVACALILLLPQVHLPLPPTHPASSEAAGSSIAWRPWGPACRQPAGRKLTDHALHPRASYASWLVDEAVC